MKILITNDDGIFGLGLIPLISELSKIADVCTVVPEKEMSAASHSFSLQLPVRIREINIQKHKIYLVSGTPADCVRLGIIEIQKGKTDIVVSGINQGPNLAQDVFYSGTVAAAREAAFLKKTAIAVSLAGNGDYHLVSSITKDIVCKLYNAKVKTLLNINFPPTKKIRGIKIVPLGERYYQETVHKRKDPFGMPYYWLKSKLAKNKNQKDTDVYAIAQGYITITPLTFDLTNYTELPNIKKIFNSIKI